MIKIALFGNPYQQGRGDDVLRLFEALAERGLEVHVHKDFNAYLHGTPFSGRYPLLSYAVLPEVSLAVSVGGDGTLLRSAQRLIGTTIPVLGINTGHLGYLTTADISEAPQTIDEWMQGKCRIEERTMLEVECDGIDGPLPLALNEVAILRHHTSSMIAMTTTVDGVPLTTYKGDGLVICTPTGSTAYNMSAGGPIMAPTTRCLALSPVSPHSLTTRPLVVRDDVAIEVSTRSRSEKVQLSIDGSSMLCASGSTVRVKLANHRMRLVLRPDHNFALTLRKKLLWGVRS